jgi:GNAT superfamily N-acetyltransferase
MIVVRLAELADIPAFATIERSAVEAFRATSHTWVADDSLTEAEAYPPLIAAHSVWVAEHDGVPAGFVFAERCGADFHILELAVHLGLQRRGMGRALVNAVVRAARGRGCAAVTLTTFRDVAFNAPFYESLGFEILAAPPARLAGLLAIEARSGLTDRCAMMARIREDSPLRGERYAVNCLRARDRLFPGTLEESKIITLANEP